MGLLRWVWERILAWRRRVVNNAGDTKARRGYPVRWNLLIIAFLIALLNGGIIGLTFVAISKGGSNQFITGALIGLLPTGITGLVGLGMTLLSEKE